MTSNRASAWQSQRDTVPEAVLADVPQLLLPILEKASRGRFVPESGIYADDEEIISAIAGAVGRRVKRVVRVSYAAASAESAWTKKDTYSETLSEALEHRLGFGLSIKLGGQRWKQLREQCGYEEPVRLVDYLAEESIRIPKENLRASVFAVSGFVFAQDLDMATRLKPLLRLMPRAIPLGELRAEPGTWFVLVP